MATVVLTTRLGSELCPVWVMERYGEALDLVTAEIPVPFPVLVESAFWHPSRSSDPAVLWLLGILRTVAERIEFAGEADQPAR